MYVDKPPIDELMHYGMPRRSGRYPWGSGEHPYQHSGDFLARVEKLRAEGYTYTDEKGKTWTGDTAIAKDFGLSTTQLRTQIGLANDERRMTLVTQAKNLREAGYGYTAIGREMGLNESTVRSLLNSKSEANTKQAQVIADKLKARVDEVGMVDVGTGVEKELGCSKAKLNQALSILEREGYDTFGGGVPQVTNPGKQTNLSVLCPPGSEHKDIYNYEDIHSYKDYVGSDGEKKSSAYTYPKSMDSSRLQICYGDQGGKEKDGLIEIRRGVDDLSLGDSHYAQVRILVDGTHYLKGMAIYADDLPDGVDVRFNTNKNSSKSMTEVLKEIKKDPENPFGALLRVEGGQSTYTDKDGNEQLSLINKTRQEGDWGEWSHELSSQFLAKQPMKLINQQLTLATNDKKAEYDEICNYTNPTVKKALLLSFANDCDSAAVHLKAAALPRQKYHVIIPVPSLKSTEVYAPGYDNGEQLALIRFPHAGTFEIPILTVNNKQKTAKSVLGNAADAVGINSSVAERLSGADYDGDTVLCIPTNNGKTNIKSTKLLDGLQGFDPKDEYPYEEGMSILSKEATQKEMGVVSNLIMDMTLKGATEDELAAAVRHSMVVIDANKHKLNYKQSEVDNNIAALKKKYQGHIGMDGKYHEGASTLITRAKGETSVVKRQGSGQIDPETGAMIYKTSDKANWTDAEGKVHTYTQKSTQMAEVSDAYLLSSGTPQEEAYAEYANAMKSLANQARKEWLTTQEIPVSSSAKETYAEERASLTSKLNLALLNAPRERQAQVIANAKVAERKEADSSMTKKDIKKYSQQALSSARLQVGAQRNTINITDEEWEAIQAGAISKTQLSQILNFADQGRIKELASPKTSELTLSQAKQNKITSMNNSGYSIAEIAKALGISTSTVSKYIK